MTQDAVESLKHLKDALRSPIETVESFIDLLSTTFRALGLGDSPSGTSSSDTIRPIRRYLPSIQASLLTLHLPTFLPALDVGGLEQLRGFFAPRKETNNLAFRREIALTSYLSLSPFLAAEPITSLPRESRHYVLELLIDLQAYSITDVYWTIWSSASDSEGSKEFSARQLLWEEAVSVLVGLPTKVANAVGRWTAERWGGDVPGELTPR